MFVLVSVSVSVSYTCPCVCSCLFFCFFFLISALFCFFWGDFRLFAFLLLASCLYMWRVSTGHGDGNNRKKNHCNWWCAACGGQHEWKAPNRILGVQLGGNANEAKVFKAHAAPVELCGNLSNTVKLLANQQKDGDSPIQIIVTGLHRHHGRTKQFYQKGYPSCGGRGSSA